MFIRLIVLLTILFVGSSLSASSIKKEALLQLDTNGHRGLIKDIVVSENGKMVFTASNDMSIRMWDLVTGLSTKKFNGYIGMGKDISGDVNAIAISPDEKYIVSAGALQGNIRLYDFKSGKLLHTLPSSQGGITDLVFSKGGKYLVSSGFDHSVKIWDMDTFSIHKRIDYHKDVVVSVETLMYKDNEMLISTSYDSMIAMHELKSAKFVKNYENTSKLKYLAVSDTHIAACGDAYEVLIFNHQLDLLKIIRTKSSPQGLAYSPDGKWLMHGFQGGNRVISIYEVSKEYKLHSELEGHIASVMAVAFIDNNTIVTAGGENFEINLWDRKSKTIIKQNLPEGTMVWSAGIKGDEIAFGNTYDTREDPHYRPSSFEKSFNLKTGKVSKNIKGFKSIPQTYKDYTLSYDIGGQYNTIDGVLHLKKNGKIVAKIESGYNVRYNRFGFYKNYIITTGERGTVYIFDFEGKQLANLIGHAGSVWSLGFDGNRLITASTDNIIKIWDLSQLEALEQKSEKLLIMDIAIGSIADKAGLRKFDLIVSMDGKKFQTFDTMSQYLKQASECTYQVQRNNKVFDVHMKKKNINDKLGLTYNYAVNVMYPLISLFVSHNNEWILWTNDGFFDASKNGTKYIGYHINQGVLKESEFVSVDRMYNTFYRPDLVQRALRGESLQKYADNININKLLGSGLAPEVKILTKSQKTDERDMNLGLQVCTKDGDYNNLTLMINGMPVSITDRSRRIKLKKHTTKQDNCFTFEKTISLLEGENRVGFKATNKKGDIESNTDVIRVVFDNKKIHTAVKSKLAKLSREEVVHDLHILAIGVNEYKEKDLKLNYSINDANGMLSTIKSIAKPLFNEVHTYELFDKDVTRGKIFEKFAGIKSTREDVFLLYIAGHGLTDEYNGNYYYIPYDFTQSESIEALREQGISQQDFTMALSKIVALKSLILIDTCNSGSFVEKDEERYALEKTTIDRLSKATGRATLSASSKQQVALEGFEEHGVFTFTLIEALKGRAYGDDAKVSTNELADYVDEVLPERTYKKWGYMQMPQRSLYGTDFILGGR